MKAEVGDIVKIVNTGHVFPSYISFYVEQGFPDLASRHQSYPGNHDTGRVIFYGRHRNGYETIYAIELGADGGGITLVGERGIEFVSNGDNWVLPDIDKGDVSLDDFFGI